MKTVQHIGILITLLAFFFCDSIAQATFRTIVSQGPIVAGESFQVQYVIEPAVGDEEFLPPDFKNFHVVSGPNIYEGAALNRQGLKKLKNIVYTLTVAKPGNFLIPGAGYRQDHKLFKSENVWLQVIGKPDMFNKVKQQFHESNEGYYLKPDEDPYQKIRENLFIKVFADKRTCFAGEAVTATFKLYSRLESRSDIVKNPGFYGFTVQDVINLDDHLSTTENVSGKNFDVHVIRKVQLYPLQAGIFHIDAMEVRNRVEFSKSMVPVKTEQVIKEGVFTEPEKVARTNTVVFENSMSTKPVTINVKPAPKKNMPADYTGATGQFSIHAKLVKDKLAKNEATSLVVSISGSGNFTQLDAPVIKWPSGIESLVPDTRDSLNAGFSPLSGKREFLFSFVSARPGKYIIPPVRFSFFNPVVSKYERLETQALHFEVNNEEKTVSQIIQTYSKPGNNSVVGRRLVAVLAVGTFVIFVFLLRKKRRNKQQEPISSNIKAETSIMSILQPAYSFAEADSKTFYNVLRICTWEFLSTHFELTGSKMNKKNLLVQMDKKNIDSESKNSILEILTQCEEGMFANAEVTADKVKLLDKTKALLKRINNQ